MAGNSAIGTRVLYIYIQNIGFRYQELTPTFSANCHQIRPGPITKLCKLEPEKHTIHNVIAFYNKLI